MKDVSGGEDVFDDEETDDSTTYNLKYLGNTIIDSARSENATKEAVKSIIHSAKATGKNKLQRVSLSISPKGIDMFDALSLETLLQVSIYNISYCSADANHSDVFAFVSCENTSMGSQASCDDDPEGTLTCYAFLCQKKKVAQEVTLTVARSFERAYQLWKRSEQSTSKRKSDTNSAKKNVKNKENEMNEVVNLLIDLDANLALEKCSKDSREYLQNTWVSRNKN